MNEEKPLIVLSGQIASGKGTVAKYLRERYRGEIFRYSDILKDILSRLGLAYTRANLASLGEALRGAFGGAVLSETLLRDIAHRRPALAVLDGLRKKDELAALRAGARTVFVFIEAPAEVRYRRLLSRGEKKDETEKTFEQFLADQRRPADKEIAELRSLADYVVRNDSSPTETFAQIDDIMEKI
ncbi:MAG TPA: hypothetical protein ENJ77_00450 [Candidatus Moranbacteria bacterium]|nr:hypothetical protein [Candidatus Moranbacteria bacterium]